MVRVAEGVERRGSSLRLTIYWKGQRITETHPGAGDAAHIRRVVKRREWLLSRLRVGLPIYEDDANLLGVVAEEWLESRDITLSSLKSDRSLWKHYWSDWANLSPESITARMIKKRLSERDVSPKTKRNARGVLSAILSHAEVNPNPCAAVKIKSKQRAKVQRYRPDEVTALLGRLKGEALVYFTLLRATGLRPGEALGLLWSDWDGERLSVTRQVVRGQLRDSTKTHVRRSVYVPVWARDTINQHPTRFRGGHIFQNTEGNNHCDTNDLNAAWRRAHEKARIPYRIPYTLRHTRAAELLSQGCLVPKAAQQLGHSTAMFLNTYSEFIDEYSDQDTTVLEGHHPKLHQIQREDRK